jgi:hypothetical protein
VAGARGGEKFRRGFGVAMGQLQEKGQVVPRVRVIGTAGEKLTVHLDRAVLIAARVAHETEAVECLDLIGLSAQDLLELGARGRPVLPGHERRGEDQPGSHGLGMPAQERAKLLDGSVEVAHLVEREPQIISGGDQVWL